MDRFHKIIVLAFVVAIPAAATPLLPASQPGPSKVHTAAFPKTMPLLCFTAGATTYALSQTAAAPDFRVKFDNAALDPDLRIGLADGVAAADFALVDDVTGLDGNACRTAGTLKTVKIVDDGVSNVVISLTRDLAKADFKLFVHSARFNHHDAAALFAVMRNNQRQEPLEEAFPEDH
jgi:hypothetical protein